MTSSLVSKTFQILLLSTAVFVMQGCKPGSGGQANQQGEQTDINEDRFYVLLFPKHEMLTDTTGTVHSVNRAAIASIAELQDELFAMHEGELEVTFDRADFSLLPNVDQLARYIENLNAEIKEWGTSTEWRSASLELIAQDNEPNISPKLILVDKRGRRVAFRYEIVGRNEVKPIGVEVESR